MYISDLYMFIYLENSIIGHKGLVIWFNGISTLEGYLMPNPVYLYRCIYDPLDLELLSYHGMMNIIFVVETYFHGTLYCPD